MGAAHVDSSRHKADGSHGTIAQSIGSSLRSGPPGARKPLHLRLMSTQHGSDISGVEDEVIYKGAGRFAPGILQNLRVFKRLLTAKGEELRHFFFAPNPRSAAAARVAKRFIDRPSVHTLCSMPAQGRAVKPSLFADRHLVLSESARIRLEREGVESHLVEPAVLPFSFSEVGRERCRERFGDYVLFAGDLRPGGGALEALSALSHLPSTFKLVITATRPKGADYERCLRQLERRVEELNEATCLSFGSDRLDWRPGGRGSCSDFTRNRFNREDGLSIGAS